MPLQPEAPTSAAHSSITTIDPPPTATTTASGSRQLRQKPVTFCLPPRSWSANVSDSDADASLYKLIASQSQQHGFDAASSSALHELSHLTQRFIVSLFAAASHGAELAQRHNPSARDLVYALETHGLPIHELRQFATQQRQAPPSLRAQGKARATFPGPTPRAVSADEAHIHADERYAWIDPTAAFLPSDSDDDAADSDAWSVSSDDDAGGGGHASRRAALEQRVRRKQQRRERAVAKRLRRESKAAGDGSGVGLDVSALEEGERAWKRVADHVVPKHLPGRPPRHCWVATAAYPPNAYSAGAPGSAVAAAAAANNAVTAKNPLILVNRKLANARLVEASLRRLIQATDTVAAQAMVAAGPAAGTAGGKQQQPSGQTTASGAAPPTDGVFATPKLPARAGLTLRLKNKISAPLTPSALLSGAASSATGGVTETGRPALPPPLATPLGPPRSRRGTLTTPTTGFPSLDPLASPLTPLTGLGGGGGSLTSYPPTPVSAAFSGQYFGSHAFTFNPQQRASISATVPRSRSASVAGGGAAGGGEIEGEGERMGDPAALGGVHASRMPGAVNYKNVWYAPSGGGAGAGPGAGVGGKAGGAAGRGVKRMRKWKV